MTYLKVPPHNLDAEIAVLGAMLINSKCIPKVQKSLLPTDFYKEAHFMIAEIIFNLKGDFTFSSLAETLKKAGYLERVGGIDYITKIMESVSVSAGVEHNIQIIHNHAIRRRIIQVCGVATEQSFESTNETIDILSNLKTGIIGLNSTGVDDYPDPNRLITDVFKEIEKKSEDKDYNVGILCGIPEIDRCLEGFEPKTLTYLIGRPSMGKTALALNLAENMTEYCNGLILFFSLEMGNEQITRRRLAARSNVYLSRIRSGNIEDSQWRLLVEAANDLSRKIILIDHPRFKTVENMVALIESLAIEKEISAVFVDHIQLMNTRKNKQSRHLEISYISNEMKSLAKVLKIPNIVLSQLSRRVEQRRDKKPILSDLKESGDLEADADVVIGIYRDDPKSEVMELGGLKGRDVGTWKVEIKFDRFTQLCSSYEPVGSDIPF